MKLPSWVLAMGAAGLVLATALVVWLLAARGWEGELADFQARGQAYAAAFAESAITWIQQDDLELLRTAARFRLLGSALFVRVSWDGELLVDEQVGQLPPLPQETGELASLPGGGRFLYLRLAIPSEQTPHGWVELGLDAGWLIAKLRGRLLMGIGVGVGVDVALLGTLAFLWLRHRRRRTGEEGASIKVGGLEIFEEGKQVYLFGQPVRLSPKQFALLRLLASAPGRVFSDREILREVWPDSRYANSKDVKQYVYLVRQRLGKARPGAEGMIVTVPGFGYKLIPPDEAGVDR